jgi:uncharacterized protein YraI
MNEFWRRVASNIGKRVITRGSLLLALSLLLLATGVLPSLPTVAQNPTQPLEDQTIYMPLIPAYDNVATPGATIAPGARVYGLVGTLERPSGQRYTYYLSTAHGGYYALAGQTPELEIQIGTLARSSDKPSVKVWGEVLPPPGAGEPPLIVVTGILATEAAVPTAVAGASVPIAVVKFQAVNLYSGPGSTYPVAGQVVQRQACEVTGRNQASSWLQLTCADGQQGWVDARLVEVEGGLSSVVVINIVVQTATPTPTVVTATPTATPVSFAGWRTELYNNSTLSGTPVAVVDVANINFNWGSSAPSQLPVDGFSLRFTRRITVPPAFYQFTAVADDGIRVWVDGRLIINAWPADPSRSYVVGQVLTGSHDIQVDYYEASGLANVRLDYSTVSAESVWQATYYYGVTPSGNPAFSRQEPRGQNPLDYNWSTGSPQPPVAGTTGVGSDYWSARWQGDFPFENGTYVFRANVDDGIRLYLDGLLVLDQWRDGYKEVSNRVIGVGAGEHTVVVEYYERTGNASIQVWWYRDVAYVGPQ